MEEAHSLYRPGESAAKALFRHPGRIQVLALGAGGGKGRYLCGVCESPADSHPLCDDRGGPAIQARLEQPEILTALRIHVSERYPYMEKDPAHSDGEDTGGAGTGSRIQPPACDRVRRGLRPPLYAGMHTGLCRPPPRHRGIRQSKPGTSCP
ncbi:MAG: hypothetical protein A4E58_00718 [Syntrophorhabdus sp. PtaB.Bin006]|nr:MAG: hypothetical protein A4E58_00718 [Syntrophorhabdus sp. PtaB.Bin006]